MGELILGRADDGVLEVMRADDEFDISDELLEDMATEGDFRREGNTLKIDARDVSLTYVLKAYHRDTHMWTAVRSMDRDE